MGLRSSPSGHSETNSIQSIVLLFYKTSHSNVSAFIARGKPKRLVFHSDQGTQYTSTAYRHLLAFYGVTQSFSYPGRPRDNAVAESFFANLKREKLC